VNHGAALLACETPGCSTHDLCGGTTLHHKCSGCGAECKRPHSERHDPPSTAAQGGIGNEYGGTMRG